MTLTDDLDVLVAQANEGILKHGQIDESDRKKILTDGFMEVNVEADIHGQDPRVQMLLFQMYEQMRAKLALAPTHITYELAGGNKISFKFHVKKEAPTDDVFKKGIAKLECAREGRPAELTQDEYNVVFAFYLPAPTDKSGTWHNKPYIVKT